MCSSAAPLCLNPPHGGRSVHKENVKERPCVIFVQKVTAGSCQPSFDQHCPDSVALQNRRWRVETVTQGLLVPSTSTCPGISSVLQIYTIWPIKADLFISVVEQITIGTDDANTFDTQHNRYLLCVHIEGRMPFDRGQALCSLQRFRDLASPILQPHLLQHS